MKVLLFPLLAALTLPTAVNAESYWLILSYGIPAFSQLGGLEKIEMVSLEACEKEGRRWENSPTHENRLKREFRRFHCVVGK